MIDFGLRLKTLRIQKNLTQKQLADRLGLTKSVISAYETQLRLPSYDTLIQISRIFQVSTDYLLGCEHNSNTDTLNLNGLTEEEKHALKRLVDTMKNRSQLL